MSLVNVDVFWATMDDDHHKRSQCFSVQSALWSHQQESLLTFADLSVLTHLQPDKKSDPLI